MARPQSRYVCQSCGEAFLRWEGQCRGCGAWNSLVETLVREPSGPAAKAAARARGALVGGLPVPRPLAEVHEVERPRLPVGIGELDRVLGGGLVAGSLVLVGPRAREVLAAVTSTPLDNQNFPWLSVRDIDTAVGSVRTLRVGYVGELGWELHAANDQLVPLYHALWAAGEQHGIRDFGIYAVDSLRLDKGYRGWKGDLEIGFSPFDASLDRFVDLTKANFVGKDALVAEKTKGSAYRFVGMTLDVDGDADAPFCAGIFDGNKRVGIVTSGGWSFTLDKSVALGYVEPKYEAVGTKLEVEIFGNRVPVTVGSEPLFDPKNERLRS